MKKRDIIIAATVAAIIVIGSVAMIWIATRAGVEKDARTGAIMQLEACKLFTLDDAKAFLGNKAELMAGTDPVQGDDLRIETCSYSNRAPEAIDTRMITISVRAPLTQLGVESNRAAFGDLRPASAEKMSGYGTDAFWDASTAQFAMLKENNWVGIVYSDKNPIEARLDDIKRIADKVQSK